ncbi:SusC/RagA family TonB-linked outer membrane protein [Hymenobacter caeli]|uniref:TonB-linked SusC/RagA family outer membrane protein n=1 Tax=Hymenobacter caeli TaxID=2735894 RepID=A0ABX2FQP8_9BACT|nr:TonB-dependent receptor [Hymenobacter caeli]NRT19439.1 TonB-linked SusC/RagA family outer membrane protein [Hymenobacter caeli]
MRTILLSVLALFALLTALPAAAQQRVVQGTVLDTKGDPLIGAGVRVKNTQLGTTVDAAGKFSLSVPKGSDALIVNFVGMSPQEITLGDRTQVDVVLRSDGQSLNDVVVVGYGSVKKSDLTGSVASIKRDELLVGTPLSFDRGLQGKVAGVQVSQNDGAPGSGISMQIRGVNSFGSNTQPLYVIDGVPLEVNNESQTASGATSRSDAAVLSTNVLNFLRPSDIESIEVLKDASATAIYGSRGANGVVIVTTRRGQSGADRVDVSFRSGFDQVAKRYKMLDAETYANYLNEKNFYNDKYLGTNYTDSLGGNFGVPFSGRIDQRTGFHTPVPSDFVGHSTDWQDVIFQKAPINEASVTFSGGGADKGSFAISANYVKQAGIITNSAFEQGNLRINITRNLTKWLTFETNTQASRSLNKLVKTATSFNGGDPGVIYAALRFGPTVSPSGMQLINGGTYIAPPDQLPTTNPLSYINDVKNQNLVNSIFSSNSLVFNVIPGLQLRTRLGLNYYTSGRNVYYPRTTFEGNALGGTATVSSFNQFELTSENIATYTRKFGEKSDLTAVGGFTYTKSDYNTESVNATSFLNDALQDNNLNAATKRDTYSGRGQSTLLSYLGRVNYNYAGKYLFTLTGRIDGSSKFALNKKYSQFGAAAFAWRVADEKFISDLDVFSDLKLRLSYGTSGNQAIGAYQSLARLSSASYVFNGQLVNGVYQSGLPSPNLTWETTYQSDAGIDIGLLKGRLNLTVDVYDKQTKNLLQGLTVPPDTGYGSVQINAGQVQNRGLEVALNVRAVDGKDFKWTPSGNISINRNQIVELGANKTVDFSPNISYDVRPFILEAGKAIGRIYGYQEDGIFQSTDDVLKSFPKLDGAAALALVGEVRYKDLNGDGVIDQNDREVIGNVNPKFVWGVNNTFNFKSFDAGFFFQGSVGNDIINFPKRGFDDLGSSGQSNITQSAYDNRWTPDNPNATVRRAGKDDGNPLLFSNRFVESGSYVRLKNVSLGYTFDFKQYGIRSARLYASVTNLVTITNYSGYDPEVNAYGQDPSRRGVDLGNYPTARSYSLGVNVGF